LDVIFLHGFAADSHVWEGYSTYNLNPVFFDIHFDKKSNPILPNLTRDTVLVGWSMGGMLAVETAKKYKKFVKGIVLISSAPTFIRSELFPAGKTDGEVAKLRDTIMRKNIEAIHRYQELLFSDNELKNGWLVKFRKEIGIKIKITFKTVVKSLNFLSKYNPLPEKLDIPVLVVHGEDDLSIDISAPECWKKIFDNIEIDIMEGGHAICFVKRKLINDKIEEFIKKL